MLTVTHLELAETPLQEIASTHLAFIGAGNMAGSLIHGLLGDGLPPCNIRVADPITDQLRKFADLGMTATNDNNIAIDGADVVVLAVKPQIAADVVGGLQLNTGQVLISIAAGIDLASLSAWTSPEQPIVRCMPNTPALFGAGMSALYANGNCSEAQRLAGQTILNAGGATLWVDEEAKLDAVTAVSGSGPAYFFLLMEAMIDAGTELGLDRATATYLTLQTAYGAALMAQQSDDPPAVLRQNVTSPGGTTAAALEVMTQHDIAGIIRRALAAADNRAGELAQEFGTGQEEG